MVNPLDSKTSFGRAQVKIVPNEIVSQFVRLSWYICIQKEKLLRKSKNVKVGRYPLNSISNYFDGPYKVT